MIIIIFKFYQMNGLGLTGDGKRGVAGAGDAGGVAGLAPVDAGVVLLATVDDAQEEEGATGQQDPIALLIPRRLRRPRDK